MKKIMNKENDWDHVTEAREIDGPIKKISREEMKIAIKAMKPGKDAEPSKVCAEIISASEEVRVSVMVELLQHLLDGKRTPDEWQTNIQIPIFKGKEDVRNCNTEV